METAEKTTIKTAIDKAVSSAVAPEQIPASQTKSKGGAPKKKLRRGLILRVRVNATERFLIAGKAKGAGMKSSTWIRTAAKGAKIVPRLTADERQILWTLTGMANNLNQLTKLAHQHGLMTIALKCREILVEIDSTLKYISKDDGESNHR